MKQISYFFILSKCLVLVSISPVFILFTCRDPVIPPAYRLILPTLPPAWEEVLAPPHWRLEWLSPDGRLRSYEGPPFTLPELDLPAGWASPVLAYPFWPEQGLFPGYMRPAGAIAPFDVDGSSLRLSWRAGPEAWFYRTLAMEITAASTNNLSSAGRSPDRFDWPRFRDLLQSCDIPPEIQSDPWLTDWDTVAARTVQSGFDRRRIQARIREPVTVNIPYSGPWAGSSPFTETHLWEAGEQVTLEATSEADTLVSPGGVLRYSRDGAVWTPGKH